MLIKFYSRLLSFTIQEVSDAGLFFLRILEGIYVFR